MNITMGVLGLGSIGMRHAGNLLAAGFRVKGFDPASPRRESLKKKGGVVAESMTDILNSVDGVVIASPSVCHLDDLAAVIGAGKHAFVEKPLAHRLDGVEDILKNAEKDGLTVQAGLNMRFHPVINRARALLDDGLVGDLLWARFLAGSYLPDWRPDQDYRQGYAADPVSGGALFDFIHEFDLAVYLLGPATVVAASARTTGLLEIASEDSADVILSHESGVRSAVHVDYVTRPRQRRIEIAGAGGILRLDLENGLLTAEDLNGKPIEERTFTIDPNQVYVDEMNNFLACIQNGAQPMCTGREALDVLNVVLEARRLSGLPSP